MKRSRDMGRRPGKPVKAAAPVVQVSMPVKDAFHAVMLSGIAHLQANEQGLLAARDPEYLHQMRVALRRLRSAMEIFGPMFPELLVARARRDARWLAASLGHARDWDVFVEESLPAFQREHGTRAGSAEFARLCERLRRRANIRARRSVDSLRYLALKRSLGALAESPSQPPRLEDAMALAVLSGPVTDFASAVLERRYNQVIKKGHGLGGLSSRELHRLRIAVKKFRYAVDFFSGLYEAKPARDFLERLGRLQDILGSISDAATAVNLVTHDDAKDDLHEWSRSRTKALKGTLKKAWKEFRSAGKFW